MLTEIGTPKPKGQRAGGCVIHAAPLIAPDGLVATEHFQAGGDTRRLGKCDPTGGCNAGCQMLVLFLFLLMRVSRKLVAEAESQSPASIPGTVGSPSARAEGDIRSDGSI
jgi:hypothetical protein